MNYAVEWLPQAEDALAAIWLQTFDPAVTAAEARINRLLSRDPHGNGEHRSEGLYRIEVTPLVVAYEIDDAARRVTVSWVWHRP